MIMNALKISASAFALMCALGAQNLYGSDEAEEKSKRVAYHQTLIGRLPFELINHILSFTDMQTGARSHLVCLQWNAILNDPGLLATHLQACNNSQLDQQLDPNTLDRLYELSCVNPTAIETRLGLYAATLRLSSCEHYSSSISTEDFNALVKKTPIFIKKAKILSLIKMLTPAEGAEPLDNFLAAWRKKIFKNHELGPGTHYHDELKAFGKNKLLLYESLARFSNEYSDLVKYFEWIAQEASFLADEFANGIDIFEKCLKDSEKCTALVKFNAAYFYISLGRLKNGEELLKQIEETQTLTRIQHYNIITAYLKNRQYKVAFELIDAVLTNEKLIVGDDNIYYHPDEPDLAQKLSNALLSQPNRQIKLEASRRVIRIYDRTLSIPDAEKHVVASTKRPSTYIQVDILSLKKRTVNSAILSLIKALKYEDNQETRQSYIKKLLEFADELNFKPETDFDPDRCYSHIRSYFALLKLGQFDPQTEEIHRKKTFNVINHMIDNESFHGYQLEEVTRKLVKASTAMDVNGLIKKIAINPKATPTILLVCLEYFRKNDPKMIPQIPSSIENHPDFNDPQDIMNLAYNYFKLGETDKSETLIQSKLLGESPTLNLLLMAGFYYLKTGHQPALKSTLSQIVTDPSLFKVTAQRKAENEFTVLYFLSSLGERDKALAYLREIFKFYQDNKKALQEEIESLLNYNPHLTLLGKMPEESEFEDILDKIIKSYNKTLVKELN